MSRPLFDLGVGAEVRYLEPGDAEELSALVEVDRERLSRWMGWAEGSTLESVRAFIVGDGATDRLDPLGLYVEGRCVGTIGARPNMMRGDCELGYWIAASHEGRGIVTHACRALIDHAFMEVGSHRITILAAPDNDRSRAIPERLGFTQEGVMREAGWSSPGYHDLVVYGLLDREWSR